MTHMKAERSLVRQAVVKGVKTSSFSRPSCVNVSGSAGSSMTPTMRWVRLPMRMCSPTQSRSRRNSSRSFESTTQTARAWATSMAVKGRPIATGRFSIACQVGSMPRTWTSATERSPECVELRREVTRVIWSTEGQCRSTSSKISGVKRSC